jgi:uncharacterized protein YhaN
MEFKKLIIKSFGKFQNKTIEFNKGFNLIYGENEAGKSTVHKFLEAMLFGFYKPNMKNRKLIDDYDKYFPWDNSLDYSGVMIVQDENQLRLERNFMKEKESLEIYDNETGANVTENFDYDSVIRTYEPAKKLLGLNKTTYNNTVSISQMGSKTSEQLVGEIKNNIINLGDTQSIDISLEKIQKEIADNKAKIGNVRSRKSKYYEVISTIEVLEQELEDATKIWGKIKQLRLEENELAIELDQKETDKNTIEKRMNRIRNKEFEEKFKDAKRIKNEIKELDEMLIGLEKYKDISKQEINDAIENFNKLEIAKKDEENIQGLIDQYNDMLEKMQKDLKTISEHEIEIGNSERISRDVYKYEEFENSKQYVSSGTNDSQIEEIKVEIEKLTAYKNKSKLLLILAIVFTALSGILTGYYFLQNILTKKSSFFAENALFANIINPFLDSFHIVTLVVGLIFLGIVIAIVVRKNYYNTGVVSLELKLDKLLRNIRIAENRIQDITDKQNSILEKYNVTDIGELVAEKDKRIQEEVFYQENYKRVENIESDINNMTNKLEDKKTLLAQKKSEIGLLTIAIDKLKGTIDIDSYEDFNGVIDEYYEYKRLQNEKANKQQLFEQITKGKEFEEISREFGEIEVDSSDLDVNYNELEEALKVLNEEIIEKNKTITAILTAISNEENAVRKIVDIVEDLSDYRQKQEEMDKKLKVYSLIEEAMEEISNKTHNNFAPGLNKRISEMIAVATDYKYTELKVNPEMEVLVVDNDNNKLVSSDNLSAGTIDLVYFALRLAIADIINEGKNIPIILDDCFVQYDERRLVKMLELLAKQERQVIMLTCHKREKQLLEKIVKEINVITL